MPNAARLADPVGHSPTMSWLLRGLLIGAGIGLAFVVIAGTGGLAAAAIIGGFAASGASIGELASTMSFAPKNITGVIAPPCSSNVFTNSRPAARAHVDTAFCAPHMPPPPPIATGSDSVFINSMPAARVGDKIACSAVIVEGSPNVFIGGGTKQTDLIHPEELVPPWVHKTLFVVGLASAVVLVGPLMAIGGLAGGILGGTGGGMLGGAIFGEGSDGQKLLMLGGSILGGAAGMKGAPKAWNIAERLRTATKPGNAVIPERSIGSPTTKANSPTGTARELAESYAANLRSTLPKSKIPRASAAAVDTATGEVYYGRSGEISSNVHPELAAKMPAKSLEHWRTENCAEFNAMNNALHAGAKFEAVELHTVITKTGNPFPRCQNCQLTTHGATVTSD